MTDSMFAQIGYEAGPISAVATRVVHVDDKVSGAIYIGRAMPRQGLKASPLANPYKIGRDGSRTDVITFYQDRLNTLVSLGNTVIIEALIACRDRPIACWCRRDGEPHTNETLCHGDVIVDTLSRHTDDELRALGEQKQ